MPSQLGGLPRLQASAVAALIPIRSNACDLPHPELWTASLAFAAGVLTSNCVDRLIQARRDQIRMKIIIVGAGVTGLSTAYHLARQRAGEITLIDKGPVGDGSSGRAAAIITGHLWTETGVQVRKRCLELYRELSRTLPGYSFRQCGCLNLFEPASWNVRKSLLPLYERLSVPFQILSASEINARWPAIQPPEDWTGLFDPLGGYSEPDEYIRALVSRVEQLGVEVRESNVVTGLRLDRGRVTGVHTLDSTIGADAVIATVFAWTRPLLKEAGLIVPVKSFVHQRYVSEPLCSPLEVPAVNANPNSVYFRPTRHGAILAGLETAEREEYPVDELGFHLSQFGPAKNYGRVCERICHP